MRCPPTIQCAERTVHQPFSALNLLSANHSISPVHLHKSTMAPVKFKLVKLLEELRADDLKRFTWYLSQKELKKIAGMTFQMTIQILWLNQRKTQTIMSPRTPPVLVSNQLFTGFAFSMFITAAGVNCSKHVNV
ncbi:hypothetical protein JZ751_016675 [Albula glossodonta]|uniref:Pyrin domain-containing protein n=1 Tax=Albula glossodonta TaxID=121402 RepID=A0A8T2MRT1_9TELE|nr:hypothetical protein JZ751_016675 [Albula glossodonta]